MKKTCLLIPLLLSIFNVTAQKTATENVMFIDTHNDVLSKQIISGADLANNQPDLNFDLPKANKGSLVAQVFSIWCDEKYGKGKAFARANQEIDSLLAFVNRNSDKVAFVTNSKELKKAIKKKRFAAMIGVEGGHMIEDRMDYLDSLINRGMKYLTLTWNNSVSWATSARDEETKRDSLPHLGLTDMGRRIVARLNEAGVMVDVSHVGEQTFKDVMETSTKPVIASHSCAWALSPHRRNLKDSQLLAIAKSGGVVFVNFYSEFLDSSFAAKRNAFLLLHKNEIDSLVKLSGDSSKALEDIFALHRTEMELIRPPLNLLVKNIDYIAKLIGPDHVGIGADYDGAESFPLQMDDVSSYPVLVGELEKLGYTKNDIKKIAHGNFIRVLEANERK
jgi:membrane dipeptidase